MVYDTIIIGAGSMGMSAGYFLAKQGKQVLLLDSFDPPHNRGSHHGETRIIRHAYGEGAGYVPLVLRAQELWKELEEETGKKLFYQTGVLNVGKPSSPFIQQVIESASEFSLPLEVVNSTEVNTRWPGISLPEEYVGCLETSSGVLKSEVCIAAYREQAEHYGASLHTNTEVVDVTILPNEVIVKTEHDSFHGQRLIVTAGAWASKLLQKAGIQVPLTVLRKTFSWFSCQEEMYGMNVFPAFTFDTSSGTYYGFPSIEGAGVKVGRHDKGLEIDPDDEIPAFGTYEEDERDVTMFLRKFMPQTEEWKMGKTCMYTMTPDEHFIIDSHPEHSHVVFACGFSGHGFKFSSVVGEQLAELVINGTSAYDLSIFSAKRFSK